MLISSISAVRPAAIMKPVHVRRYLGYLALLLHIFTLLWTSLSSVISKPNILFPESEYPSGMRETVTPYMQGIEKNTGNYIYLTEEEVDLVFAFRSSSDEKRKLATGFLHSDK